MPQFNSFEAMAAHFAQVVQRLPTVRAAALDSIGQLIEDTAKAKLGDYQPAAGPFAAWQNLAVSTITSKTRQRLLASAGRVGESPELVTGEHIQRTIHHRTVGTAAHIGSDDPVVEYQEVGTNHIPPRSFLGSSLFEQQEHCRLYFMLRITRLIRTGA